MISWQQPIDSLSILQLPMQAEHNGSFYDICMKRRGNNRPSGRAASQSNCSKKLSLYISYTIDAGFATTQACGHCLEMLVNNPSNVRPGFDRDRLFGAMDCQIHLLGNIKTISREAPFIYSSTSGLGQQVDNK